jgi:15-cis-phytoene synthase
MHNLYHDTCNDCSRIITQRYSTSFSMGIKAFDKEFRAPIYAIYGFVRLADEIVDTFHDFDKEALLNEYREATFKAIYTGISLNPVLHAFQQVVKQYQIDHELITAFLDSMAMDLHKTAYNSETEYNKYIYGSAEVVGLMCLQVFCQNDRQLFDKLVPSARSLGAAFQKVNFLRDMQSDYEERGRVYFPGVDFTDFTEEVKLVIVADIQRDFDHALEGILQLPAGARKGVHLAYVYYLNLFKKIRKAPISDMLTSRIRVSDRRKALLMVNSMMKHYLNLL